MSSSLWSHGLQRTRLPCPSPSPRVCSNSCSLSQCCHPTISSSVIPFSSFLQSFLALESFLISKLFASGGQSIGASASASVLLMNIQNWFPLGLTGLISLQSKGLSQVSNITTQKHQIFAYRLLYGPALTSILRRRGLWLVHLGAAERIYPMSEVRGRSQEDPMPEGQQPRGVITTLRAPGCNSTGTAE